MKLVPLGRMRIHDILLWCDLKGQRAEAVATGKEILKRLKTETNQLAENL